MQRLMISARLHPFCIRPLIIQIPNYRSRPWGLFVVNAERISFLPHVSVMMRNDVVLVQGAFLDVGDESFPYARCSFRLKLVGVVVPIVETAYNRNFARIGGPYGKVRVFLGGWGLPCAKTSLGKSDRD